MTTSSEGDGKFHFAIDRGGTFTDVYCRLPDGSEDISKLLSEDPANYPDAPTEGIRRVLQKFDGTTDYPRGQLVPTHRIGSIRMGTTVATNALLERDGAPMALLISKGFADILQIGDQSRPDIFDLKCAKPSLLYEHVVEIDERIVLREFTPKAWEDQYPMETGITGEQVQILKEPDLESVRLHLETLRHAGITALAVCLLHAYVYPEHERRIGELAESMGCFSQISLSHVVMPMVKLVSRGHTTCAAAYLTPKITTYLASFQKGFDANLNKVPLTFMKSDGGLAPVNDFGGHQAILSGPAGGVVGYAKTTAGDRPCIGFDMGGTSSDFSRYAGTWEHVFETVTAGVAIQAPQLDIHTVAAGGGSRLFLELGLFRVGPESARAHPGPVCYRKNGYLAVTDANVVLGRVVPKYFPNIFGPNEDEPLDVDGAKAAFEALTKRPEAAGRSAAELAYGFWQVANEAMCRPIRNLTQMKGYDITTHTLACFGGAGPQHACAMAKALGMSKVFVHRYGGILSAYGLSMADAVHEEQEPAREVYNGSLSQTGEARLTQLAETARAAMKKQGYSDKDVIIERFINMRYDGTDNSIMVQESPERTFQDAFVALYMREFGFTLSNRDILIDDYRIRAVVPGESPPTVASPSPLGAPKPDDTTTAFFEDEWRDVSVYKSENLEPGHEIEGPAIIIQPISTVVVEMHCKAFITANKDIDITVDGSGKAFEAENEEIEEDPVQLSIFAHRFMGIAEQMGRTLQRTSISVNMKERLDFSCALFTKEGGLVANAPHIPVHLGAMERAVRFQVEYWNSGGREGIKKGEVLVSNHPQLAGGSHLPDITVITPVFINGEITFFLASRGHHSDIGGISPGSMPPHSRKLEDEGAMIVAFKLVRDGAFQEAGITDLLMEPGKLPGNSGTRNLRDVLSDLRAQVAANNSGIRLLQELCRERGLRHVEAYMHFIQRNAEHTVRNMLVKFAEQHGSRAHAIDYMDDGSAIELTIEIDTATGSATFDFTGTAPQVMGNHNAPPAVTYSAVIYSLRCLVAQDIPLNQGCLAPIIFKIPPNCLLNPSEDAGVVGGNVLTSQRVVDVVLRAFGACAASQGCMNNLTFGDKEFGYYETIAGGSGAGPTWKGTSGVHTHCTNTRITDPEILERRYPVLLRQFSLRKGSGGRGRHTGGDGVIRELEPLRPLVMSILSERRTLQPYGLEGGESGQRGRNLLVRSNGILVNMGGRYSGPMDTGERLRIETPGGGGYGKFVETTIDHETKAATGGGGGSSSSGGSGNTAVKPDIRPFKSMVAKEDHCISFADVEQAAKRIADMVHRTPVLTSASLNVLAGNRAIYFKVEAFQRTGSFKFRGALNAVRKVLEDESSTNGGSKEPLTVLTHSSGNHGQALALAAKLASTPSRPVSATIVMPENTPLVKKYAVADFGAQIVMTESTNEARRATAARIQAEQGALFIHPSENERVIAGQGTVCLELIEQVREITKNMTTTPLDAVIIPVGGGGLAAGNLVTLRALLGKNVKVILAEPKVLDDAKRSFEAGELLGHAAGNPLESVADGLKTTLGPHTFGIIRDLADAILTVSEQEIMASTKLVWERLKVCIEPSAGVGVAVLLSKEFQETFKQCQNVGVILCGGNADFVQVAAKMRAHGL